MKTFIVLLVSAFIASAAYAEQPNSTTTKPLTVSVLNKKGKPLKNYNNIYLFFSSEKKAHPIERNGVVHLDMPINDTLYLVYFNNLCSIPVDPKADSLTLNVASKNINVQYQIEDKPFNTGYGYIDKKQSTAAISQLNVSTEFKRVPYRNVAEMISGQFPGVSILRSGGGLIVNVRGFGGGGGALVLIDGIPTTFDAANSMNVNDIKTIDIIKDSSTALYGIRGANGVVLITTRRGDDK